MNLHSVALVTMNEDGHKRCQETLNNQEKKVLNLDNPMALYRLPLDIDRHFIVTQVSLSLEESHIHCLNI